MNWIINYTILLPGIAGVLLLLVPGKLKILKSIISFVISMIVLYFAYKIFKLENTVFKLYENKEIISQFLIFNLDNLSKLIVLFIGFFSAVVSLYSIKFIENNRANRGYYGKFLLTLAASIGAVMSAHLITFTLCWGFLGLTLYRFLRGDDEASAAAAKKSFIIIGASDSILIMGLGLIWLKTGNFLMTEINLELIGPGVIIAFISLLIASITKAGAFPMHTWVPDYAETAPSSISAFLPASLDKLLGIYFLVRICMSLFVMNSWSSLLILIIGSITIIAAVMMALVQHNYKKLLAYHAVSQVGYMVTGIGLGSAIGIAGGLFHMLNHALYKSGLFLTAGAVRKQTGEKDLDNLGGLITVMPLTFISALVFALSISGVPPFNGFVSKWIIYQGIVNLSGGSGLVSKLWFVWLGAAVIGSALTLASFIKLIGGIYLGKTKRAFSKIKEVSILMWLPSLIITFLCIGFGIWGTSLILPKFVIPVSGEFQYPGLWQSQIVGVLILIGLVLGVILYSLGTVKRKRRTRHFVGAEIMDKHTDMAFPTVEFYKTVAHMKFFNWFYKKAQDKYFDIYDLGKKVVLYINSLFSQAHTGILTPYIMWALVGLVIILLVLV